MDIRNIFFKLRSYTPIPIALAIIYNSQPMIPFNILGILLIVIGEIIRINAVRYAGGATRTRNVGAPSLCTSGPYSHTRNPLYWGNIIIYAGVAFLGGGQWMWYLVAIIIIFFISIATSPSSLGCRHRHSISRSYNKSSTIGCCHRHHHHLRD